MYYKYKVDRHALQKRARVKSTTEYYAYLEADSKQVGQLKTGQMVILKLASFPHYYYGVLKAEIVSKSNSPNNAGHFLVRASIIDKGDLGDNITKGLTGSASVILENKTIFDHIFRVFLEKTSFD